MSDTWEERTQKISTAVLLLTEQTSKQLRAHVNLVMEVDNLKEQISFLKDKICKFEQGEKSNGNSFS